jgi:hypothetical protein
MNENNKQIETRLEKLGGLLRSQPSVVKNGMQKIEHIEQSKLENSGSFIHVLYKSGIGLAACLLIGIFLWLVIFGSAGVTLADVQKSIENKTWILITHHGKDQNKEWINLKDRKYFSSRQQKDPYLFHVTMRDHVKGIWLSYHSNWGEQIHEETFAVRPYPQTPWEYAVGGWEDRGQSESTHKAVEKVSDKIDGKPVVRFDTYSVGPLDLRVLIEQVWADPETRLPIRIRQYSSPEEFTTGDFSFPETGPSSIYELGVSRELPVVHDAGVIEPEALAIINSAKKALQNLPKNMRIIQDHFIMYYRIGNKLRTEYYGKLENNTRQPVEFPKSNENIRQWAMDNLTLFKLKIYDGEYEFSSGIKGAPLVDDTDPSIEYRGDKWMDALIPLRGQWDYINNAGPIQVVKDKPDIPQGCVLLRWQDMGLRRDWYIDTAHDYICVKEIESRVNKDTGEYINPSEIDRTNLTRLPSGQWYAGILTINGKNRFDYDVTLLSDSEIEQLTGKNDSKGFFDGAKVIKSETDKGKKVRFWAK